MRRAGSATTYGGAPTVVNRYWSSFIGVEAVKERFKELSPKSETISVKCTLWTFEQHLTKKGNVLSNVSFSHVYVTLGFVDNP